MKIYKPLLVLLLTVMLASSAVGCAAASINAHAPLISSLVAEHTTLYPLGNTVVTCSASSPDGAALKYSWACDNGTITKDPAGDATKITYEAPRTYGDFHIISTVDDGRGNSVNKTVTVTVIVRDPSKCCR
ncbi:MAG: PKD domain-containing protein [Chloroflexi bacterium]|nr:PKD domain-containing protein [Chloroflexota bacterium]